MHKKSGYESLFYKVKIDFILHEIRNYIDFDGQTKTI